MLIERMPAGCRSSPSAGINTQIHIGLDFFTIGIYNMDLSSLLLNNLTAAVVQWLVSAELSERLN